MYRFLTEAHDAISLRKITILEQTQGRKRGIHSPTAPRARCPPCCRLWAVVRPRRAEVGYGYPPGLFGRVLGSFSVRRKRSRRKGRRRGRPRPGHFCPQCGQLRRSTSGVVEGDFRRAAGSRTEMIPQLREKLRGRGKISRRKMKWQMTRKSTLFGLRRKRRK